MIILKEKQNNEYSKDDWDLMFVEVWKNEVARKYAQGLMEHYGYSNFDAVKMAYFKVCVVSYKPEDVEVE